MKDNWPKNGEIHDYDSIRKKGDSQTMKMVLKMGGAKTAKHSSAVNPTNALVMTDGVFNYAERIGLVVTTV